MIVVVKEPGAVARIVDIDGRRRGAEIAKLVGVEASDYLDRAFTVGGGYRDAWAIAWCDDDGLRKELPINFARPTDGAVIVGTIVVTGLAGEGADRDAAGLTEEQAREVLDLLAALGLESAA